MLVPVNMDGDDYYSASVDDVASSRTHDRTIMQHQQRTSSSTSIQQANQMRELVEQCDHLRRELNRKEGRNDKLTKELQRMRLSFDSQQRELRSMMVTLDKVQEEKLSASNSIMRLSNTREKLSRQVRTALDGSAEVSNAVQRTERANGQLEEEITKLKGALSLRDNKIEALVKELEIAHRSMEVQHMYQNPRKYPHIAAVTSDTSREAMRTLYFDLGKKQAEIHALTLTLAEIKQKLGDQQLDNQQLNEVKQSLLRENERLRYGVDSLTEQSIRYNDTISELTERLNNRQQEMQQLQETVSDLSSRLTEAKSIHDEITDGKDAKIAELTQLWTLAENDKSAVNNRFEAMQQSSSYVESMHAATAQRLNEELSRLRQENQRLSARDSECQLLQAQLESTRGSVVAASHEQETLKLTVAELQQELQSTNDALAQWQQQASSAESKATSAQLLLSSKRDDFQQAAAERNETAEALKQTMAVARDLSQKYQKERELRFAAEKMSEQLQKAKNNFSAATIAALHREKQKTAALEKSLSLIPLLLRYKDLQWKDPAVPLLSSERKKPRTATAGSSSYLPSTTAGDVPRSMPLPLFEDAISRLAGERDSEDGSSFDWLHTEQSIESLVANLAQKQQQQQRQEDVPFTNTAAAGSTAECVPPPPPLLCGLRSCTPAESLSAIIDTVAAIAPPRRSAHRSAQQSQQQSQHSNLQGQNVDDSNHFPATNVPASSSSERATSYSIKSPEESSGAESNGEDTFQNQSVRGESSCGRSSSSNSGSSSDGSSSGDAVSQQPSLSMSDGAREADSSLIDDLKRLRDELRRIEVQLPTDISSNTSANTANTYSNS